MIRIRVGVVQVSIEFLKRVFFFKKTAYVNNEAITIPLFQNEFFKYKIMFYWV